MFFLVFFQTPKKKSNPNTIVNEEKQSQPFQSQKIILLPWKWNNRKLKNTQKIYIIPLFQIFPLSTKCPSTSFYSVYFYKTLLRSDYSQSPSRIILLTSCFEQPKVLQYLEKRNIGISFDLPYHQAKTFNNLKQK